MGKHKGKRKSKSKKPQLHKTARSIGLVGAAFTLIQALIWIILTAIGIVFFFLKPDSNSLAAGFSNIYFGIQNKSSPAFIVKPVVFLIILVVYLLFSLLWFIASINFINVLRSWHSRIPSPKLRDKAKFWMIITLIICIIDVAVFVLFVLDYVQISKSQGISLFSALENETRIYGDEVVFLHRDELSRSIEKQRDRIRKLKSKIKQLHDTGNLYKASVRNEIASINPFLGRKKSQRVRWPAKKIDQNITATIGFSTNHEKLHIMDRRLFKVANAEGTGTGDKSMRIPTLICMTLAFRGFLIWIINVVLLTYFFTTFKKLIVKSNTFFSKIVNCFRGKKSKKKRKSKKRKKSKK